MSNVSRFWPFTRKKVYTPQAWTEGDSKNWSEYKPVITAEDYLKESKRLN